MYNIFGLAPESNKSMFRSFDMTMTCTQEEYNEYFWSKKFEKTFKIASVPWIVLTKPENTDCIQINFLIEKEDIKLRRLNISQLINALLREYAHAPSVGTRMLTVERNSIYTFKTELSLSRSELIDKMLESSLSGNNLKEVLNKESSRYPLAIRDSLRIANDLENIQK